jgi:hypothetical protein
MGDRLEQLLKAIEAKTPDQVGDEGAGRLIGAESPL